MSITKQCTKCGEVKALDAFSADKSKKDGKQSACKECNRRYRQKNKEKQRDYYQKHREKIISVSRKWYEANKAQKTEYDRKYHENHKEHRNANSRKYHQENKDRRNAHSSKYHKENPEVGRRTQRKRRALLRNLPHQPLTPQQYDILHRQKYEIFGGNASGN